ncbi:MAG TPA: pentapeptide repeat-containing protein [Gemmataceae bacterium]
MPAKKPALTSAEWVAVLKTGAEGVKKWNRLTGVERAKVKLSGADLSGCDLAGINLSGVTANGASFAKANLTDTRLPSHANDASFIEATLPRAKATKGVFDVADFSQANLAGVEFSNCRFHKGSFAGANLTAAKLTNIALPGADLSTAILTDVQIVGGSFDAATKWPAGFLPPGDMAWSGRGTDPRLVGKGKKAVAVEINGLMARLHAVIDPARMKRTIDMLKKERHQLFAEIEPTLIRGIVRSQKEADLVYSCVLTDDGTYACCTPNVELCLGLRGEPCKHILVLLIGLARAGQLDVATADRWATAGADRNHRWNKTTKNHVSETLLKYKGVQAGDIDWRPTETIPEDFYAM